MVLFSAVELTIGEGAHTLFAAEIAGDVLDTFLFYQINIKCANLIWEIRFCGVCERAYIEDFCCLICGQGGF